MRKFRFNKLIRDRIVDELLAYGNKIHGEVLNDTKFLEELKKKVIEETKELDVTSKEACLSEIIDIQESIDTIMKTLGITEQEVKEKQKKKNEKIGCFDKRQFVDYVEVKEDYPWIKYYEEHADLIPEIKD